MRITVLIAVYNSPKHLPAAIKSIQKQSYKDWEIVLIDDGSDEDTKRIIRQLSLKEPRITLIVNEHNRGLAYSLNRGLEIAAGELICRADADDINLPERFMFQVRFMDEHPEVDVLGTAAELVSLNGEKLGVSFRPETHEEIVRKMYRESPFFHSSVMFRRSFYLRAGGYNEKMRFSQDAELWYRTYKQFCFHNLQLPLIQYRTGKSQSLTRTYWAMYAILRGAYINGCLLKKGHCAFVYGLSAFLSWLKLGEHRPKAQRTPERK